MKKRKSYIWAVSDRPNEAFVVFGGGIGIKTGEQTLTFNDEEEEYLDLELTTLENEFEPGTTIANDNTSGEDMPNTPHIHLMFNSVSSVDALITALQDIRKMLL